jgi:hypothetical protein
MTQEFAYFSRCRKYRYLLGRTWDQRRHAVLFLGLNPSTADEKNNDPTVRRCIRFAKDWGFGTLLLANLFALRSTNPIELYNHKDPVGCSNDDILTLISASAKEVVFAWGTKGGFMDRDQIIKKIYPNASCLGVTKGGHPKHPLYIAASTPLKQFVGSSSAPIMSIRKRTKDERLLTSITVQDTLSMMNKRTPCVVSD